MRQAATKRSPPCDGRESVRSASRRLLSQVLTVLTIWAFVFLVGMPTSAVRAALMLTLYALLSLGYRDRSTTYDGKGNILSHSTAGQYGYGTAKPYAFNELLTASPLIPAREQHIVFNAIIDQMLGK